MTELFSPLEIRSLTFPNRLWVSPMCQYSAIDGVVQDWHLMHLGVLATGGAGLVLAEATGVNAEGRISIGCPGLYREDQVVAWRRVVDFVHQQGALIGVQLAHAGRKASTMPPWADHPVASAEEGGWTTVAPSALAFGALPTPRALTLEDIRQTRADFVAAGRRALAAGFDVLEIHAAHGYLLHEFLSPLSNVRDDQYGGSVENRCRLLVEVAADVRALSADVPLFVRISATDWVDEGWTIEDSVVLAAALRDVGVDLIDVSSGGNVPTASIPVGPGYQVPLATRIREATGLPTAAVGVVTDAHQAEEIVRSGAADAVLAARAFMRNPRFAFEVADALGVEISLPPQLARTPRYGSSGR